MRTYGLPETCNVSADLSGMGAATAGPVKASVPKMSKAAANFIVAQFGRVPRTTQARRSETCRRSAIVPVAATPRGSAIPGLLCAVGVRLLLRPGTVAL